MIWVLSAGRSGSGWLSTVFAAMGCKVQHEWYPVGIVDPDVIADTTMIHSVEQFVGGLSASDIVILLDRDEKRRMRSVEKLLGRRNYGPIQENWERLKTATRKSPAQVYEMTYEGLFDVETRDKVRVILFTAGFPTDNLNNFWAFARHQRITNMTSEQLTKESLGL